MTVQANPPFKSEDYARVATLIRQWSSAENEPALRAVLSNNLNMILSGLEVASAVALAGEINRSMEAFRKGQMAKPLEV